MSEDLPDTTAPAQRVKLPRTLGFMVRRLQQVFVANFHQRLEPLGITPAQFTLLSILRLNPGIEQVALAAEAALDPSTVADVLRRLNDRNLVRREISTTDKRKRVVTLTEEGARLLDEAREPIIAARSELMQPLSEDESKLFLNFLERLLAAHERSSSPWTRSLPPRPRSESPS